MSSNIVSGNEHLFETSAGSATLTGWAVGTRTNGGVVVLAAHEQTAENRTMSTLSVDGVSFTNIGRATPNGTSGTFAHTEIWACDDTSAGSIVSSDPVLSVTMANSGTAVVAGIIETVTDVDQTLSNWQAFFASDGRQSANPVTASLTGFASGNVVLGVYCDASGSVSVNCQATGGDATTEFTSSDRNFGAVGSRCVQFHATAASGSPTYAAQRTSGTTSYQSLSIVGIPSFVGVPTISSLGDSTPNYQGSTTITGTGFPTSQTGSAAAHLGGVAQTVTWNTSTSCSIASIARGDLAYGNYNLTVTDAAGNTSANYATSLSPQAGWKYITTSGTLADPSLRLTTTPVDIVSGNQISVGNVVGGTIDDITLYVDGSYSCAASVISFDYEVHDGTEWGAVGTEYPSSANGKRGLSRNLARTLYGSLNQDLSQ